MAMIDTKDILNRARDAKDSLALLDTDSKNKALSAMADALTENADNILAANALDMQAAKEDGHISPVMLDRLQLTKARLEGMAQGVRALVALPDPVGTVLSERKLPNGLTVTKYSVPFGVIAIIYESRPNVTSDAAALTLKSGNVCVLRGGKEAWQSAKAIVDALRNGLASLGMNPDWINLVEDRSRESARELMHAVGYVDLLIPRGGAGLIRACVTEAEVPCIETGTGICHVYVDENADIEKALNIVENAKMSRPSVCNAEEVLLVSRKIAPTFLPLLEKRLADPGKAPVCRFCADGEALALMQTATPAEAKDFDTEFLDYKLAVKVVAGVEEAVAHIAAHSTHHSEAIITGNPDAARYFTSRVDSAAVYVNASTRFTDGGEFGLGCEMGISTQKLHARGPMGLCELNTTKYIIQGDGQIR